MKVTLLGCGPSSGVPTVIGDWGACDPENPKNRRRRPSILVQDSDFTILVDTSPDIMAQLLDAQFEPLTGSEIATEVFDGNGRRTTNSD